MRTPAPAFLLALLAALPLHAAVVEHDFLAPGDGLLTYDDVNQREWLDLPYTSGMELSAIQSQMNPGGLLEGFEFATLEDIEPLALSAEVLWQDTERIQNLFAISPVLLPRSPPISVSLVRPTNSAYEAKELFDLLGNVFTVETTETYISRPFFNFVPGGLLNDFPRGSSSSSISITDLFRYSFGQIADEIVDDGPRFSGTNVTVFSYGSGLSTSDSGLPSVSDGGFGGIALGQPEGFEGIQLPSGDTGPFWLYRTAIPEPTSIFLLALGAIALLSTRYHRCYAVACCRKP